MWKLWHGENFFEIRTYHCWEAYATVLSSRKAQIHMLNFNFLSELRWKITKKWNQFHFVRFVCSFALRLFHGPTARNKKAAVERAWYAISFRVNIYIWNVSQCVMASRQLYKWAGLFAEWISRRKSFTENRVHQFDAYYPLNGECLGFATLKW